MVEIEDIKLFERAVDERLTAEEADSFQKRLDSDEGFRANFEKYRQIIAAVNEQQHYDALNTLLDENYKTRNWALSPEELKNQRTFWPLLLGGAAILVLIAASIFWLTREPLPGDDVVEVPAQADNVHGDEESNQNGLEANTDEDPAWQEFTEEESVADVRNPTAFLIGHGGFFLTQYSAIRSARSLRIRQLDSTEYKVEIVLTDSILDFAVLKIVSGSLPASLRLPYRLATTRALVGTEVMVVDQHNPPNYFEGVLAATDEGLPDHEYVIEPKLDIEVYGSPVVSRNGNVVAIGVTSDGSTKFIKSTYLLGTISANANQLEGYRPGIDNWLAGLERDNQVQRMAPYLFEVIRFY